MNYAEELVKIEQKNNDEKIKKATLEERKRKGEEEETIILEKLKKEEITENKLEDVINDLSINIEEEIITCQEILNGTNKEYNEQIDKEMAENGKAYRNSKEGKEAFKKYG